LGCRTGPREEEAEDGLLAGCRWYVVVEGGAHLGVNMYVYLVRQTRWWHEQYTLHLLILQAPQLSNWFTVTLLHALGHAM